MDSNKHDMILIWPVRWVLHFLRAILFWAIIVEVLLEWRVLDMAKETRLNGPSQGTQAPRTVAGHHTPVAWAFSCAPQCVHPGSTGSFLLIRSEPGEASQKTQLLSVGIICLVPSPTPMWNCSPLPPFHCLPEVLKLIWPPKVCSPPNHLLMKGSESPC